MSNSPPHPLLWASLALSASALAISVHTLLQRRRRKVVANTGPTADFYSAAQVFGDVVYASGQVGMENGKLKGATAAEQTPVAIENLLRVLEGLGVPKENILKTTVYLEDIGDYGAFNEVYTSYFTDAATRPARVCFAAKQLPLGAKVEIECVAFL